jgi:hypothetical protein
MQAKPSPEELLMGMVDAKLASQYQQSYPYRDFRARVPLSAARDVYKVADERDMSVAAYTRRALIAFVAYDRGLDFYELLQQEPATRMNNAQPSTDVSEAGQGHGLWRIGSLY